MIERSDDQFRCAGCGSVEPEDVIWYAVPALRERDRPRTFCPSCYNQDEVVNRVCGWDE